MKKISATLILMGMSTVFALTFGNNSTYAASMTIDPGDNVWAAVDQLQSGDTLTFNPGTYSINDSLPLVGKDYVTLVGVGNVILEYNGDGAPGVSGIPQAIQIYDSQYVTISNLTIDAIDNPMNPGWETTATGIEINSSCYIDLSDLTVSGFGLAAITITALQDSSPVTCASGNLFFDNLDLEGDGYGVLFTNGASAPTTDIGGVNFSGTTTINGVTSAIVVDTSTPNMGAVTGFGGNPVYLGTLHITTNGGGPVIVTGGNEFWIMMNSIVNGYLLDDLTAEEIRDLLGVDSAEIIGVPAAPGVPDTGAMTTGSRTIGADIIAMIFSIAAIVIGFAVLATRGIMNRKRIARSLRNNY